MKVESEKLAKTVMECFDNSMDDRFSSTERANFLTQGKELRNLLVKLLSVEFEEGTKKVLAANKKIEKINAELKEKDKLLKNIAAVTGEVVELTTALDDLLKAAAAGI